MIQRRPSGRLFCHSDRGGHLVRPRILLKYPFAFGRKRGRRTRPQKWGLTKERFLARHRSLRASSTLGGKRNVLKRFERVALLKKRNQWKDGDRVTGLRKTKPEA